MSIDSPGVSKRNPSRQPNQPSDSGVPAAIDSPVPGGVNSTYLARFFNPWFRVSCFNQDTGEARELSRDILSLDTKKMLSEPAGEWSLTLNPRRIPIGGRNVTWADIVRPQDSVEIRMGIAKFDPGVVVMRGFVDHCHRIDAADPQRGLPARRVLISGRDFGKLWLDFKVFYLQEAGQYAGTQTTNLMQIYWGIEPGMKTPADLFGDVYNKLFAPKIGRLRDFNHEIPVPDVACEVPDQFQINEVTQNFMTYTGALWNLMQMYISPPFTEFFVRDVPGHDKSEFRWRWAPLTKLGNRLALPWTPHPPVHTMHADLIQRYDVDQSDNQRYTYFWAPPGQYGTPMTGLATGKLSAPGYIDGPGIDRFGYKDFQPDFQMYRLAASDNPADDDRSKTQEFWVPQIKTNVQWLADTMLPNDKFLEGTLLGHLRPDLIMGDYVEVPEEGTRFYIEGVSHSMTVTNQGVQATTAVQVTRGQRLGDRDVKTPESYKYSPDTPIPGGSLSGSAPSAAAAADADTARSGGASGPGATNTPAGPAPPFVGGPDVQKTLEVALALEGRADYNLGTRNYNKATLGEALASVLRPVSQGGGIDCSELVAMAFKFGAGLSVPPPAQAQYNQTPRVSYDELAQGDILFFGGTTGGDISGANITHSGLYLGNGEMVNAQDFGQKVKRADITSGYWRQHFVSGGRIFTKVSSGGAGGVPNQH